MSLREKFQTAAAVVALVGATGQFLYSSAGLIKDWVDRDGSVHQARATERLIRSGDISNINSSELTNMLDVKERKSTNFAGLIISNSVLLVAVPLLPSRKEKASAPKLT